MGMFDTIRCSYDLGPGFWNRQLQTKDIECLMIEFWLDPAGRLFEIDYSGTQDFVDILEEEMTAPWNTFEPVPNGNHGKVRPYYLTKTIKVYPSVWDCKYAAYPTCQLLFKDGIMTEVLNRP